MSNEKIIIFIFIGVLGLSFSMYLLANNFSDYSVWYSGLVAGFIFVHGITELRRKIGPIRE
jgi:hypothetical protein